MTHYLNNAGAALMAQETRRAIDAHFDRETAIGAYRAAQEAESLTEAFYARAAQAIGASSPGSIAFMDSASRAWNMALHGLPIAAADVILTLSSEFGTNLVSLYHRAQQMGAKVKVIHCDMSGDFDMAELIAGLDRGARIVAISHAAAHGSIVNPVQEVGVLAKQYGALYLVDGCQAIGQIPVDVGAIQCDAYTATGRKWLRGPRGTGFLYVNPNAPIRSDQLDLASADLLIDKDRSVLGVQVRQDARQFELWERSVAGMIGLSTALGQYVANDMLAKHTAISAMAKRLRDAVAGNPNLCVVGHIDSPSGIVGFYIKNPLNEDKAKKAFEEAGVSVSQMGEWDCPLHFPQNGVSTIFRLSAHYYTDPSDVAAAISVLTELR